MMKQNQTDTLTGYAILCENLFDFSSLNAHQDEFMPAEARRSQIIDLLGKSGTGVVSVTVLAGQLGVSEMTIRRDLDWLEQHSILTRVHGGAISQSKRRREAFR